MKINKILIIVILLIAITILIVSFKTQTDITNSKKNDIPKIVISKVTIPKIDIYQKESEDDNMKQKKLTEYEVENILSKLRVLKPIEKKKKVIVKKIKLHIKRKPKKKTKKRVVKKIDIVKKREIIKSLKPKKVIIYKELIIQKRCAKKSSTTITAEEYRERLAKESKIDIDIASLSMVRTVDMDIEQKIEKGKAEKLTTPKPLVEQKTIYIPSSEEKIDNNIPWAELIDYKVVNPKRFQELNPPR